MSIAISILRYYQGKKGGDKRIQARMDPARMAVRGCIVLCKKSREPGAERKAKVRQGGVEQC